MNREQKRNLIRNLKNKNFSKEAANRLVQMQETKKFLKEGQKVKLNLKSIKSHPDYNKLTEKYRNWIDENLDKEFTVEYDEKYKDNPTLVCLKEDTTYPKWLFWEGDLIEI